MTYKDTIQTEEDVKTKLMTNNTDWSRCKHKIDYMQHRLEQLSTQNRLHATQTGAAVNTK